MESIKNFLVKTIDIGGLSIQYWMFLAAAVALILVVIVLISSAKNSKKEIKKRIDEQAKINEVAPLTANEASKQYFEVINQKIETPEIDNHHINEEKTVESVPVKENFAPIIVEAPVIEPASVIKQTPVAEKSSVVEPAPVEKQAPVIEKASVTEKSPVVKKAPVAKPVTATVKAPAAEKKPIDEKKPLSPKPLIASVTIDDEDIIIVKEEANEKTVSGKFTICNSNIGGFRYSLFANNGQLLYESRDYKGKNTCTEAVDKFCTAVKESNFTVKKDKFDRYKFVLRPYNNSNAVFIGESFKDKSTCLNNIESVKRFASYNCPIVDRTKEDFVAISSKYEIPSEIRTQVNQKSGASGKWEIAKVDEEDKASDLVYLLYANNGQLLYESKDYKSYSSCKSGLETFISTIQEGNFIIDADKAGRYKFILRSNKPGSQAEYIGQFYRNEDACKSSISSVYKFALLSSLDNLQ